MDIIYWIAVGVLASSYWFQVWKIHVHKEVRDLSVIFYIGLTIGFLILIFAAHDDGSTIFVVKNTLTAIPAFIILMQIWYHRNDSWDPPSDETVYIVIKWTYDMPVSSYIVHNVYNNRQKADEMCKLLNIKNENPVEEDDYGPMRGCKYDVWERQLDS